MYCQGHTCKKKIFNVRISVAKLYYGSLFFRKYIKTESLTLFCEKDTSKKILKLICNPPPFITDSIMKDLTCGDLERQNKALTAADEFLKRHKAENGEDSEEECRKVKTKSDRTVISKSKEKRRLDPSTALNQMVRFCVHK